MMSILAPSHKPGSRISSGDMVRWSDDVIPFQQSCSFFRGLAAAPVNSAELPNP
jgi:hypothetical protein